MLITAKTIVTGDGKTVLQGSALCLEGNRIKAIGPLDQLKAQFPGEEVKDYGDATILPGLIDLHTHIGAMHSDNADLDADDIMDLRALNEVQRALFKGVTTLRDTGCPAYVTRRINKAVKHGLVRAPRIETAGYAICSTGGHGHGGNMTVEVDGVENLRAAVRLQIREGARWIKLMTSHRSDVSEYTQEELNAVADEAHRWGRKVAVHTSRQPSLQMVINAGLDTIEHGCDLTPDQAREMAEKGIVWVPTLYVHRRTLDALQAKVAATGIESLTEREMETYIIYTPAVENFERHFKMFADMGVLIATGTDMTDTRAPMTPVPEEVELMVRYGMSPVWAIGTGTLNAAKVLGLEDQLGELAAGKLADILVVAGDASSDITVLNSVQEVIFDGKIVRREI